jgi:hypothetical protein
MTGATHEKTARKRLKASVDTDHEVNFIDLFVDCTGRQSDINIVPNRVGIFSDYLRDILTPIVCPSCNFPHVRRSSGRSFKEWIVKFTGRRAYYCTKCDWKEYVKVGRWEWEVLGTAIICLLILAFASVKWIAH